MPASPSARDPSVSRIVLASAADAALVIVFAAVGRASHGETVHPAGLWITAWPFLAALLTGWIVTLAWRAPARPLRTGLGIWAMTLVGGMLLRTISGQGTALPFIVVAAVFLGTTLVGWRALGAVIARRRRQDPPTGIHSPE